MIKYFKQNNERVYDVRGLCVIRDHKSVMVQRIKYLEKFFDKHFESLELFITLKQKCDFLVMLYLKYGIYRKPDIMTKIINVLADIDSAEREAVEKLIIELEDLQCERFVV